MVLFQNNEDKNRFPLQISSDDGYKKAKLIVNSISVVNDAAERGVKLGYDFLGTAVKEERYQRVLQVVENSRHTLPNARKRKLFSSLN